MRIFLPLLLFFVVGASSVRVGGERRLKTRDKNVFEAAEVTLAPTPSVTSPLFRIQAEADTSDVPTLTFGEGSPVCEDLDQTVTQNVCVTLPETSTFPQVDVFLLFDDTGSFAEGVPAVSSIFAEVVSTLQTSLPGIDFGFGVGRFEDYNSFGGRVDDQPFILNQPIITSEDAGGELVALINAALSRTAPGGGTDSPETAMEGLFQVATGMGLDMDMDGLTTGSDGQRLAGSIVTQTSATGYNGDVPAFFTLAPSVRSSGIEGGAGFRLGSQKLVLLATDICSVSPFDSTVPIPDEVSSRFATVKSDVFDCFSRDGVRGVVAPENAATVLETVDSLVASGIKVIGLSGSTVADPLLEALAALTNAVDTSGQPLVFDINSDDSATIQNAIVEAIETTAAVPVDVEVATTTCNALEGLMVESSTGTVENVAPGETACFDLEINNQNSELSGSCEAMFFDESNMSTLLGMTKIVFSCGTTPREDTLEPTLAPTRSPTLAPPLVPTFAPTLQPTLAPTNPPVLPPGDTVAPTTTTTTTSAPSNRPTDVPSSSPSSSPTAAPSSRPTSALTKVPSAVPSASPSSAPSPFPSVSPTVTFSPSVSPSISQAPVPFPTEELFIQSLVIPQFITLDDRRLFRRNFNIELAKFNDKVVIGTDNATTIVEVLLSPQNTTDQNATIGNATLLDTEVHFTMRFEPTESRTAVSGEQAELYFLAFVGAMQLPVRRAEFEMQLIDAGILLEMGSLTSVERIDGSKTITPTQAPSTVPSAAPSLSPSVFNPVTKVLFLQDLVIPLFANREEDSEFRRIFETEVASLSENITDEGVVAIVDVLLAPQEANSDNPQLGDTNVTYSMCFVRLLPNGTQELVFSDDAELYLAEYEQLMSTNDTRMEFEQSLISAGVEVESFTLSPPIVVDPGTRDGSTSVVTQGDFRQELVIPLFANSIIENEFHRGFEKEVAALSDELAVNETNVKTIVNVSSSNQTLENDFGFADTELAYTVTFERVLSDNKTSVPVSSDDAERYLEAYSDLMDDPDTRASFEEDLVRAGFLVRPGSLTAPSRLNASPLLTTSSAWRGQSSKIAIVGTALSLVAGMFML